MATINNHDTDDYLNEKQTVLIVDDSKVIRLALNKILKNDFIVLQANDGEDAWDKLQENDAVTAIFSDVSMPNLDGFGLLERVRTSNEARISELPFIIITANDDDPDFSSKVSNAGGNDLITKPFKTDEIKACIRNHIAIEQAPQAIPAEKSAAIPEQEAAEILGIDSIESNDIESTDSLQSAQAMNFSIDENFFENSDDTASAESSDELTMEASLEQGEPSTQDSNDLSSITDIDFSFDENILDETLDNTTNATEDFEFTIDEEFLNSSLESTHKEVIADDITPIDSSSDSNATNELGALSFAEDDLDLNEGTPVPSTPSMELSLEPEAPANKLDHDSETGKNDLAMTLEQARQHAMEVAKEKVQPAQDEVATKAHQTTERDEIRARLQQIREQEKQDLANARNARRGRGGNSTSLFSKLGRIISKLFVFRKK